MKRWLGVVAVLLVGACVEVNITSTRRPGPQRTIEPVAFVIFQGSTPGNYPTLLKHYLLWDADKRDVRATVAVISGLELDEDGAISQAANGMNGLISLSPAGVTVDASGQFLSVVYDGKGFRLSRHEPVDGGQRDDARPAPSDGGEGPAKDKVHAESVWRARISFGGGNDRERLQKLADEILRRLIADEIITGFGGELKLPLAQ